MFDVPLLPLDWLKAKLEGLPVQPALNDYQEYMKGEGQAISEAIDRNGTPRFRMFDALGRRIDQVLYPPEYWSLLRRGYTAGIVWRAFDQQSLLTPYLLGYITSFYDPGLYCPYTVSLSTAVPVDKYSVSHIRERYLPHLIAREETTWQGATWMTEAGGGSDLGATVETTARDLGDHWELTGDKFFCSNVGAELAVVAARPEGAPSGVRGLELFLVPRERPGGELNYNIRRLKDKIGTRLVPTGEVELRASEGYLLGSRGQGVYLILETLNLSRVANSVGSVALAQRALVDAWAFAQRRVAFGKNVADHPLLRAQFLERQGRLDDGFALAWESVRLIDSVWREVPPYSDRYHLFRLIAHLAKYWTAEMAVQMSLWSVQLHGGAGILADLAIERLLRESIILPIWEGTPQRQMLDAMEVMERKKAHWLLRDHLMSRGADREPLDVLVRDLDAWLARPPSEREAQAELIMNPFAETVARTLAGLPRTDHD